MRQRSSFLLGFARGLIYPLRGMRFVFGAHPGLVRYWIVPVVLMLLAFGGLGWVIATHHTAWASGIWSPSTSADGATGVVVTTLHSLLDWGLMITAFAVGSAILLLCSSVVAAPFNDALSAAVERIQGTLPENRNALVDITRDLARSVVLELMKVVVLVAVMAPLLMLNLVLPVIGGPLMLVVGPLITVTYLAIDYTDWPAARRGVSVRDRLRTFVDSPGPFLGFGVTAWALLFVPGINLLLMPAAVAGGTLLYLDLHHEDEASSAQDVRRGLAG